jgi:hypothetical protein
MGEVLFEFVGGLMDNWAGVVQAVLATPIEHGADDR